MSGFSRELRPMRLPCGGVAHFDRESECSFRCSSCLAVVGSIGQPQRCKDIANKHSNWAELGGKGWDYSPITGD